MVNEDFVFGIDLSRYNTSPDGKQQVDFDVIAAHDPEVVFIAMRAGISWGYQDPWFAYYFREAGRIGRARLAYHVLYPGEAAQAQIDNFFRILGEADLARTPLVLDLELDHGQTVSRITATTTAACRIIRTRTGRTPILYSRAGSLNCLQEVEKLMRLGTADQRLVLASVSPERHLRFYPQPDPQAADIYMNREGRFYTKEGVPLKPWCPPVGRYARLMGSARINLPWDRYRLPACFVARAEYGVEGGRVRIGRGE